MTQLFRKMRVVSFHTSISDCFLTLLSVFVQGPYLVRSAQIVGSTALLTGDIVNSTTIEVLAPKIVKSVNWNGKLLKTSKTSYGSLQASISNPKSIQLPALHNWKFNDSLPEKLPDYDDSGIAWVGKTKTSSHLPSK